MKFLLLLLLALWSSGAAATDPPTISFYGDSFVYRSAWQCDGLGLTPAQCNDLKADSSFVSYIEHPYGAPQVWFEVVDMDGVGGSTCLPRTGDPGMANRLSYSGERYIGVMIGINDVNLVGTSVADTIECLKDVWSIIADDYDATPIAMKYPPISGTVWPVNFATADQRRTALNSAIGTAVTEFNNARLPGQKLVVQAMYVNYDPSINTSDGVHPSPAGASAFAKFFFWTFN